jgi:thiol peroxidase
MATITLDGTEIHTAGELPERGASAPEAQLTTTGLEDVSLDSFEGRRLLNIFPSVDTRVCANSVREFAERVAGEGVTVLNISEDLPFAHSRFNNDEEIEGVVSLSSFRSDFADTFGLRIADGPMQGLCSRAVVVLDEEGTVVYTEQVSEIADEPDYDAALEYLQQGA